MRVQRVKASELAHEDTPPAKADVTRKSRVGGISVVALIRTELDHSQKAETARSCPQALVQTKLELPEDLQTQQQPQTLKS